MTKNCKHGVLERNCYTCHLDHTQNKNCPDKCWCKHIPKQASYTALYECMKTMMARINELEALPKIQLSYHDSVFKRIKALEDLQKENDPDPILISQSGIDDIIERLESIEGYIEMEDRITASDILQRLNKIESRFPGVMKSPYKCPLCNGDGKTLTQSNVAEPFEKRIIDSLGRHFTWCSACEGKGIIWG